MKHRQVLQLALLLNVVFASAPLRGQGFINLNFESANLPILPPGQSGGNVTVGNALPGWQVFYGTSSVPNTTVLYNNYTLSSINASIFGPGFYSDTEVGTIEGNFMPFLQSGLASVSGRTVSLAQTGLVPAGMRSIQFKVAGPSAMNFGLYLNGQALPLFVLSSTASYTLWGAPVNGFTGQVAELRFTVQSPPNQIFNSIGVDSFEFLSTAVPEPGTWALLALGGALLGCGMVRRKN